MMPIPATRSPYAHGKRATWVIVALAVIVLLVVGYFYRHYVLSGLDLVGQATGGRTSAALCLALAVLVLVGLVVWMFFPLFVYFGLRDLSRRTAELDQTMKLCAQHLARPPAEPPAAKAQNAPAGRPGPGTETPSPD